MQTGEQFSAVKPPNQTSRHWSREMRIIPFVWIKYSMRSLWTPTNFHTLCNQIYWSFKKLI